MFMWRSGPESRSFTRLVSQGPRTDHEQPPRSRPETRPRRAAAGIAGGDPGERRARNRCERPARSRGRRRRALAAFLHPRAAEAGRVRRLLDQRRAAARARGRGAPEGAGRAPRWLARGASRREPRAFRGRGTRVPEPVPLRRLVPAGPGGGAGRPRALRRGRREPPRTDPRRVRLRAPDPPHARPPPPQRRLRRLAVANARLLPPP